MTKKIREKANQLAIRLLRHPAPSTANPTTSLSETVVHYSKFGHGVISEQPLLY